MDEVLGYSHKKKHLLALIEAIEAVTESRASEAHLELEIGSAGGNRRIQAIPVQELIVIHEKLLAELRQIRMREKNKYPKNLTFRFR